MHTSRFQAASPFNAAILVHKATDNSIIILIKRIEPPVPSTPIRQPLHGIIIPRKSPSLLNAYPDQFHVHAR